MVEAPDEASSEDVVIELLYGSALAENRDTRIYRQEIEHININSTEEL